MRDDPNVKKAYNFRLLAVFFAMVGGLTLARTLLPSQSWLVHSTFGVICTWFPYWLMTVYATNPALVDAMKEAQQGVGEQPATPPQIGD